MITRMLTVETMASAVPWIVRGGTVAEFLRGHPELEDFAPELLELWKGVAQDMRDFPAMAWSTPTEMPDVTGSIAKYNHTHDEMGRFGSGHTPGVYAPAGTAVAAAKTMPKFKHAAPHDTDVGAANAYEAMTHNPDDPRVKASYQAFSDAIMGQYHDLKARGFKFEPQGDRPGYANSKELIKALDETKTLRVFMTDAAQQAEMGKGHPMLQVVDAPDLGKHVLLNDVFRGVHDIMGHGVSGGSFGVKGERAAWQMHRRSLPKAALPALWNETRGQAAWTNAGPHMQNLDGSVKVLGDEGFMKLPDRPFAVQKAGFAEGTDF